MDKRDYLATSDYQRCTRCVMDNKDDTDLYFNEEGVCNRCIEYEKRILPEWNYGFGHEEELTSLISKIKKKGKHKKYDCILGLSGGLDSSYMLHLAVKEWGLRPFVFHIDAGWDFSFTIENIKKITDKLGVELHVEKLDESEMREMQLAWFRTGLASLDVPQDHSFIALIDKYSQKLGIKYIFNGYNISTEVVADPKSWDEGSGHTGDKRFVKDVIKKYCDIPIKKYTFTSGFRHKFFLPYVLGIKTVKPLNLVPITREQMVETLKTEYGYEPYEQKHFEDLLTKFLEGWWLPSKFGYDVRKSQLSSLILTNQISREEALKILEKAPVTESETKNMFSEVASRMNITEEELTKLYELPKCKTKFKTNTRMYDFGIRLFELFKIEKRIRK